MNDIMEVYHNEYEPVLKTFTQTMKVNPYDIEVTADRQLQYDDYVKKYGDDRFHVTIDLQADNEIIEQAIQDQFEYWIKYIIGADPDDMYIERYIYEWHSEMWDIVFTEVDPVHLELVYGSYGRTS